MNQIKNESENQYYLIQEWSDTKGIDFRLVAIGILVMISFTTLILLLYISRGIVVFYDPNAYTHDENQVDVGSSTGILYVSISLILHILLGFIFIVVAFPRKNKMFHSYIFDKKIAGINYSWDDVIKSLFNLWLDIFRQTSQECYYKEFGNRFKKRIMIPKKNIEITYYLFSDDDEPKNNFRCFVEIRPFYQKGLFIKPLKYINRSDLIDVIKIINQIFDPDVLIPYFQKQLKSSLYS